MSITKIPAKLRTEVLNRDSHKCLWCHQGPADGVTLHIDHIHPERFGGTTTMENLGTLCNHCNLGKGGEYYGSYLLSTIIQVPNIWDKIKKFSKEEPCLGTSFRWSLSYYKFDGYGWQENKLRHEYFIEDILLISKERGSSSSEIQIREIEKNALLEFKNIVKNFLFKNKGFFELSGDEVIFKNFKEK